MTKIMLVEDDKSLREIYGVRLLAEGYDIVSAQDGEEALAMAIKERPTLIISDVMMPKISGFDMLDILRSTTETRNVKVIMMTALSSDEQRARGEQLGADRYLVKSQVGIEDVVHVVHEVLSDANQPAPTPAPQPAVAQPQAPAPQPVAPPVPQATAPAPGLPTDPHQPTPAIATPPAPQADATAASAFGGDPSTRNRTIAPINDPFASKVNIGELLDKELAKEAGVNQNERPPVLPTEAEKSMVNTQIQQFSDQPASSPDVPAPAPAAPTPAPQAPAPAVQPQTIAPPPVPAPAPQPSVPPRSAAPTMPAPARSDTPQPTGPPLPPGHAPTAPAPSATPQPTAPPPQPPHLG